MPAILSSGLAGAWAPPVLNPGHAIIRAPGQMAIDYSVTLLR
jgi:hypothetical protein